MPTDCAQRGIAAKRLSTLSLAAPSSASRFYQRDLLTLPRDIRRCLAAEDQYRLARPRKQNVSFDVLEDVFCGEVSEAISAKSPAERTRMLWVRALAVGIVRGEFNEEPLAFRSF